MLHPVVDAFWLNKYSIWEDHRFTRARGPVNNELSEWRKYEDFIRAFKGGAKASQQGYL
jgi:hypothetical protein